MVLKIDEFLSFEVHDYQCDLQVRYFCQSHLTLWISRISVCLNLVVPVVYEDCELLERVRDDGCEYCQRKQQANPALVRFLSINFEAYCLAK